VVIYSPMTCRRQHLQAFKAIAVAAFVAMLFVLAPSAAKAHAGHSHSHATAQQASKPDVVKQTSQELKAAPVSQTSPEANDCSDRGCCDSGPCTGCHGFVLVAVPHPMPPLLSRLLVTGGAPPHLSPQIYRLRRPPKSFI
jgi:hypothetical protein